MTSVFSAISGVFGRAMIIGALLPATLFVLFCHLILAPMLPWEWRVVARIGIVEPEWKVAAFAAMAVVVAGLLHVLNTPIIRFYEGYPWAEGFLGRWRKSRQERLFDEKVARRRRTRELRPLLRVANANDPRIDSLWEIQDDVDRAMMALYPPRDLLLPTTLGNIIRSFETYPTRQYGISAIVLWPRFAARLEEEHAGLLENAKTSFDVTIHLSFLAFLAALLMLAAGCAYPIPFASLNLLWWWLVRIGVAAAIAWLLYVGSLSRARAWGDLVRGAFDLHRAKVLRDFGISPLPRDLQSERSVWTRLSQQIIFGDPEGGPALRFDVATLVLPENDDLILTRSITTTTDANVREVSVRVENRGTRNAIGVKVIEHLAANAELLGGSASVRVEGANPYYFILGDIGMDGSKTVRYKILIMKS